MIRLTLHDSVYVLEEPTTGLTYQCRDRVALKPLATGSHFGTAKAAMEAGAIALQGLPHELVRVDG